MRRYTLVACARWETANIVEWASYHLSIGFDHIYLYCNDDDPMELYRQVYPFLVGPTPSMTFRYYPFQGHQWRMYMDYLKNFKDQSLWVSFLDIDEFLCLKHHDTLVEFVASYAQKDPDCIFFNWLQYGHNGHVVRPSGNVLTNYTRREESVSPTTKVIVKTENIDLGWMRGHMCPFWHGVGNEHFSHNVFNGRSRSINVLGDPIEEFQPPMGAGSYVSAGDHSERIIDTAYVAHFFMKSEEDFVTRAKRGVGGDFSQQVGWEHAKKTGYFKKILDKASAVEDDFLVRKAASLIDRVQGTYVVPFTAFSNLAKGKPANQISVCEWSKKQICEEDAAGGVSGRHTGSFQFHTGFENDPWWSVDLLEPSEIHEIRLFNRLGYEERLTKVRIEISNDGELWTEVYEKPNDRHFGGIDGTPLRALLSPAVLCRYLRVLKIGRGFLHLDQVEIYGTTV